MEEGKEPAFSSRTRGGPSKYNNKSSTQLETRERVATYKI